jgi:hypothetical protein
MRVPFLGSDDEQPSAVTPSAMAKVNLMAIVRVCIAVAAEGTLSEVDIATD